MTEYLIVCISLVGSLYWAANSDCEGYDNCISKLLTVMHDNYDGYSSSISAVQKYGSYDADVRESTWVDDGDDSSDGGGGSSGGLDADGLTSVTEVTDSIGFESYGDLQSDGSVTNEAGEIVGYYDEDTGVYTSIDGSIVDASASVTEVVLDEDGNVLQLSAVVECGSDPKIVLGFGYESQASGKYFNSSQQSEIDIDGYCVEPSYKILDRDGGEESGRIVDGFYYAVTETITLDTGGQTAVGEVVYWSDLDICAVMVSEWDSGVDTTQSDDDIYADQLALFNESDDDANPRIGSQDDAYYVEQTALYGEDTWPNDCVSNRNIDQP